MARYVCHADSAYVDGKPMYEALPYTWGDMEDTEVGYMELPISLSRQPPSPGAQMLNLGRNLTTALRHLRHQEGVRILWVDTACINQQHTKERGEQVGRMEDIYGHAHRVVVWLGPSTQDSQLAISALRDLGGKRRVY